MKMLNNNKGKIAITQILVLLFGIIAVAYAIGGSIGVVSGESIPYNTNSKIRIKFPNGQSDLYSFESASGDWIGTQGGTILPEDMKIFTSGKGKVFGLDVGEYTVTPGAASDYSNYNDYLSTQKIDPKSPAALAGKSSQLDIPVSFDKGDIATLGDTNYVRGDAGWQKIDPTTGKGAGDIYTDTGMREGLLHQNDPKAFSDALWSRSGADWKAGAIQGLQWAFSAAMMVYMLGSMAGEEAGNLNALTYATFTAAFTAGLLDKGLSGEGFTKFGTQWGIALAVGFITYYSTFEETSYKVATYDCKVWQPAEGGDNCEQCNMQGILPCSEYQCRSLGQNCELLNDEDTGNQLCVNTGADDVVAPVLEPNPDVLTDGYIYTPDNTLSTTGRGVQIVDESAPNDPEGKCVKAFTPLRFGITVSEPAMCRIDYTRHESFDDYTYDFGEGYYDYNHTQSLNLPSAETAEAQNLTIYNNNDFNLYVKCVDGKGNENEGDFVFRFCVDQGPDTTAPLIVETSIINGMPVADNQSSLDFTAYVNEPADCKWDSENKAYEDMTYEFDCAHTNKGMVTINGQNLYPCETTLIGIKDEQDNRFYFKCRDQPTAAPDKRNTNTQPQPANGFLIIGTRPLYIDEAGPDSTTVRDATTAVKVTLTAETSAGFKEGEAACSYRETDSNDVPVEFTNTNSYIHTTDIFLLEGEYEYDIICTDAGGNQDIAEISFEVESDSDPPIVIRAYKQAGNLKIITNEPAECVYDTQGCTYLFEDGIPMSRESNTMHVTEWSTQTKFYIKCQDEYGNKPNPDVCSMVIKPI